MPIKLSIDQINYLNIWMMIVAAVAACVKPFETFLFAYAFLGPLHYLTEISWLHDRQYFSKGRYDYLFLLAAGIVITLNHFKMIPNIPENAATPITFIAFMAASIFVLVKNAAARVGLIVLAAISSKLLMNASAFESIFGIFLPTLIHVFIFTGLFILMGALQGRNLSGLLSLIVFVIISLGIFYYRPSSATYHVSDYVKNSYGYLKDDGSWTNGLVALNYRIMTAFNLHDFGNPAASVSRFVSGVNDFIYHKPLALSVMSFIAFAYLYHYLNWFSKTSVIRWHTVPRCRLVAAAILWAVMLTIYSFDYTIGLKALYFLSITHVLLEFPLNNLTFINIGKEIGAILRSRNSPSELVACEVPKN
ncbi:MAG: hypothetical protein ACLQHK_08780 [Gallionellaceae bacterium]